MARILLITHIYPPAIDGGSRVIHKIGEYFKSTGHEVAVITSDASSTDDFTHHYTPRHCEIVHPEQSRRGAITFRLPVYTLFHRPLKLISKLLPIFSVFTKGPIFKLLPFLKFLSFYLKYKPDYIIAGPLPTAIALYAILLRFLSRVLTHQRTRLLINASFHHTDPEFHNPLLTASLKSADFIWTLTNFETNHFHKNFGIPMDRMINVGNGIDKNLINKNYKPARRGGFKIKNSNNLLFVGSFSAHKGIETLIDAFALLSSDLALQSSKPPTLALAGQPTLYFSIIKKKINSLPQNIKKNIKIIYSFKSSELTHLLDQSTILVSSSTQESFGLVLLEAMARGIPVIGADIPATSELIKKSGAGLIFKTGNSRNLATKIKSILRSGGLANKMSTRGLTYADTHTWDRIGESLWQKISSS